MKVCNVTGNRVLSTLQATENASQRTVLAISTIFSRGLPLLQRTPFLYVKEIINYVMKLYCHTILYHNLNLCMTCILHIYNIITQFLMR